MNHTFDLAKKRLGLKGKLLPYRRANKNTFKCYNNIPLTIKEIKEGTDNFNFSVANNGSIPEDVIALGSGYFWRENIVEKFKTLWGASEEWDEKLLNKHLYITHELAKMDIASRSGACGTNSF
jgi:hypothetical protein